MAFTFWQRFRPNLYLAALVVGLVLWSATLPSHFSPDEVQRSAKFILILLAGYLIFAASWCVGSQARFEQQVRERRRFMGREAGSRWTVCGTLNFALSLVGVIWFAAYLYRTDSKLTVAATPELRTEASSSIIVADRCRPPFGCPPSKK